VEKIEDPGTRKGVCAAPIHIYAFTMDCDPKVKRFKKSDKAKEKVGMPSSKHVRQYDAVYVKAPFTEPVKRKKKK